MRECVIVLGMHRSGTSVLAGLVSILGGYVGTDLMPPTKDNPKGYFENNKIYKLNEKILKENNSSWDDFLFVVEDIKKTKFQKYVREAKSILKKEFKYVKKIVIKDPRICILFPIWKQALKGLKINIKPVLVYRSPLEVALSLKKRDKMQIEKGLLLWSHFFFQAEFYTRSFTRISIEYAHDLQDLPELMGRLGKYMGCNVTESQLVQAKDFYSPSLKHQQLVMSNISNDVPAYLVELISLLRDKKINSKQTIDRLRNEFSYSKKFYLYNLQYLEKELKAHSRELTKIIPIAEERYQVIRRLESQISTQAQNHLKETINLQQTIEVNSQELDTVRHELNLSTQELDSTKKELDLTSQELDTIRHELNLSTQELDSTKKELDLTSQELDTIRHELNLSTQELDSTKKELDLTSQELDTIRYELNLTSQELVNRRNELERSSFRFSNAEAIFNSILTNKYKYNTFKKSLLLDITRKKYYFSFKRKKSVDKYNEIRRKINQYGLFSPLFYLSEYPDIQKSGTDPLLHFCEHGWKEGRRPTEFFDIESYKNDNPEILKDDINPLIYFIDKNKDTNLNLDENIKRIKVAFKNIKNKITHIATNKNKAISYNYLKPIINSDIKEEIICFNEKPLISIIIPVYNVERIWLEKAIESVQNQWYQNWEILIADDASNNFETTDYLKSISSPQIKIKLLTENGNISKTSNEALAMATGKFVVLMDHDDEITPNALYEIVKEINQSSADFVYSDEDKLEMDGSYSEPHFKPDFSPELFFSQNYISHLAAIRKTIIDKVGGWSIGVEGAQDYDLYLKVFEKTNKISHIPKVLYHWRKIPGSTAAEFSDKSYAQEAGKRSLESAIQRRGISAKVHNGKYPGTYRVQYKIIDNPLISIIIPFKDKPELLDMCINSILEKSSYQNYEIIGISNNSENNETFEMMKILQQKDDRIAFYEYDIPFNYSKINNYAVNHYAKGEHILLLNNDIEIITPDWIEALLEFSQRKDVGTVGAKLYYPNDTIQHAGIAIGVLTLAGHSFKHSPRKSPCYMGRESVTQNVSAVTAACLMVKRTVFNQVNGLNEDKLKIAFNDVDFCLRVQEQGYLNVFTPYCEAYHHESISRGLEDTPEKQERFASEVRYMQERHKDILKEGDPFYNINLTLEHEDYSLK